MKTSFTSGSTRALYGAAALLALFLLVYNSLSMLRRGPYATHPDEAYVLNPAWKIVKSGDPNPHFFNYGSLPIYLSSLSLGAAAQVAKLRGEIATLEEAEPICFPYYAHPQISYAPRFAFALIAAAALMGVGLIAGAVRPSFASVLAPMLVLGLYPLFQRQAWTYVNTDIVATALATCALAYLARTYDSAGFRQRVVIPALFCGAALATKYNAGLLLLPFAIATALASPTRRALLQLVCLGAATALVFLLFEPFALLDFETFRSHVIAEMQHYQDGHPNHEGTPGWSMLSFHTRQIRRRLGDAATTLLVLGVVAGLIKDRKRTLLLLSYPVAAFAFMSMQRVNFARNLLPAIACLIPFVGLGLGPLCELARRTIAWLGTRFPRLALRRDAQLLAAWGLSACLILFTLLVSPKARVGGSFARVAPDSRKKISDWLNAHTRGKPCQVLLPSLAGLRPGDLAAHCTVELFDVSENQTAAAVAQELARKESARPLFIGLPRWRDEAVELNALPALLKLGEPLFQAGQIGLTYAGRPHTGDPHISIYALTRPETRGK